MTGAFLPNASRAWETLGKSKQKNNKNKREDACVKFMFECVKIVIFGYKQLNSYDQEFPILVTS